MLLKIDFRSGHSIYASNSFVHNPIDATPSKVNLVFVCCAGVQVNFYINDIIIVADRTIKRTAPLTDNM